MNLQKLHIIGTIFKSFEIKKIIHGDSLISGLSNRAVALMKVITFLRIS